jgi:hypothetical protein
LKLYYGTDFRDHKRATCSCYIISNNVRLCMYTADTKEK